jgi:hypothetical protein
LIDPHLLCRMEQQRTAMASAACSTTFPTVRFRCDKSAKADNIFVGLLAGPRALQRGGCKAGFLPA